MEADWDEVARASLPPPGPRALPTPATTLAFDPQQELLWAGNEFGRVSSFYGPKLQNYTRWKAHPNEGHVKQILLCDRGVISLSATSIHLSLRKGLNQWHLGHDEFKDLQCMTFTSRGTNEVLVAGRQDTMFKIDIEKGTILATLPAEAEYMMMKKSTQYICAATSTGAVHIIDPSSFKVIKQWAAHMGGINDMDTQATFLVCCGYSLRPHHGYVLDAYASVFDLKTLMQLPPIPFQTGAAFVRMHPKMSTTSIIASQSGQIQVVDLMNPNSFNLRQVNLPYEVWLKFLEIAPSGEALAMADTQCNIYLWGSPTKIQITEYPQPTEFADTPAPIPKLDYWNPETPLSSIGMPYYNEVLLSAWPSYLVSEVGAPPAKIDPAIQANLKRADVGLFTPNPRTRHRNQVEDARRFDKKDGAIPTPRFLSDKQATQSEVERGIADALNDLMLQGATKKNVPPMYGNVEIKYSKFGVDDFDFEFYNKTKFSGLETHIANSYANPLLQVYKFTPVLRNLALQHAATSCLYETCLLCEMGFLFDMLEKASGQNCQATNFLKTFSGLSQAQSFGLLEEHSPDTALTIMIQNFNRFLLDKIATDYRQVSPSPNHMEQALATAAVSHIRCSGCYHESVRPGNSYLHELFYSAKFASKSPGRGGAPTFSQVLKESVEHQHQTRAWCDRCKRYQPLTTKKSIQGVPPVLMINAAVQSDAAKQLWATPNWLPQEIGIILDGGHFFCYEGQDIKSHLERGIFDMKVYELIGVVADVNSGEHQKPHLVSMINVEPSSPSPQTENQWYLFNDFLVHPITKEEALRFDTTWKLPSILTYQAKPHSHAIDDTWKEHIDPSLLWMPRASLRDRSNELRLLDPSTESPEPGYPVAIDAEFVALQREEIEVKADGTRETVRPSRLGLARVSVLRGAGADMGLPFIDDYIAIQEPIVDYLTEFSGIHPGDLDPNTPPHAPVSLKVAYKKLWILLNLGCVFVGHGLPKDFRTINIHVPKSQVVDTVTLFHQKSQKRKLSLRFLAWCVLHEEIQQAEHDSVEDARTALRLWRKWVEYVDAGVEEQVLEEVYRKGREVGFKPPGARPRGVERENGRETPELGGASPAVTPARKAVGLAFGMGRSGGFGSPMR